MIRTGPWLAASLCTLCLCAALAAQPRRIEDPQTIELPGGARVEFGQFDSQSMGAPVPYSVFLPPSYDSEPDREFPAVYFLHGLFNDHTSWAVDRYGNIPERLAQAMVDGVLPEFLVVNPAGGRGFYTDSVDGGAKYETLVHRDVIAAAEAKFRLKKDPGARALGGTSMGGYGALKIAFKHPELYASVAAGSPIVLLGEDPMESMPEGDGRFAQFLRRMISNIYGAPVDREHWKANSVEELAGKAPVKGLNIYFFYGTADRYGQGLPLEEGVRRLHEILEGRGIGHRFEIVEGGPHGWDLVVRKLEEMFRFLSQTF